MARALHEAIPGSVLSIYEESGHALLIDESEKFNAELLTFLRSSVSSL